MPHRWTSPATWSLLVLLSVVPIAMLSLYAFRVARDSTRQQAEIANTTATALAGNLISRQFDSYLNLAANVARMPAMIQSFRQRDAAAMRAQLAIFYSAEPFDQVLVADLNGKVVSGYFTGDTPDPTGTEIGDLDWFKQIVEDGQPTVAIAYDRHSDPQILVVPVAVPILDTDQKPIGVLVAQYRLDQIADPLDRTHVSGGRSVVLIDPIGQVVAHPSLRRQDRLRFLYRSMPEVRLAMAGTYTTREVQDPITNQTVLATFMPVLLGNQVWVVSAEQPVEDVNAPTEQIGFRIALGSGLMALMALTAASVLVSAGNRNRRLAQDLAERNVALTEHTDTLARQANELIHQSKSLRRQATDLERSNAELEQFAYIASHDLQEPLRMVSSFMQLLARRYKGRLDSTADEYIGFAVEGAARMKTLIQDLLAYSRVGTRGQPMRPIDSTDSLEQALANLRVAIEETGAAIAIRGALPTVTADPTQLIQLFQNLIGNAIKFRGPRQPMIEISAVREAREWIFRIGDNGIGIDPQFHDRIFMIFQRLHTREQYAGTGIGLAVCKKIVQRHGGGIWVDSAPDSGSTFSFSIPDDSGRYRPSTPPTEPDTTGDAADGEAARDPSLENEPLQPASSALAPGAVAMPREPERS